jgi:methylaspartate mutase epsilon subunit
MNIPDTQEDRSFTILLGGIGGDSHSVGLTILHQALMMSGHKVCYLGTQNSLKDFFELAALFNVVMISNMDGHVRYYLREFPEMMRDYKIQGPLWYLGGNLDIGDGAGYERHFIEMGFDRVFVKFVDIRTVLETLEKDLAGVEPRAFCPTLWKPSSSQNGYFPAPVSDDCLELDTLERGRREVLEGWTTGQAASDLDANAEFLGRQPSFPAAQAQVRADGATMLIQPRSGVPGVLQQIKLFAAFKSAGARVLSYQVDSMTRNNNYRGADEAIRESRVSGVSTLNGFPVINHGVPGLRRIIAAIKAPLQTRHSTRDPRLLAEISYAGGVTSFEGGAICYNIPYYKDYPLDESIRRWQYVDRLTGLYFERYGIRLDREFFGTLTATLIPPSLAIATNILETLLAIQQGVKCVSLGYAEQGNRIQDVAAIRILGQMAEETVRNLGYKDIQINTVFQQYMAAFPDVPARAEQLIYQSAVTASLSGATRVIIKTPAEAYKIPVLADNLHALNLVMMGVSSGALTQLDEEQLAAEGLIIRRETQAILDSIIGCGRGSITEGIVTGFRKGFIDIPFSPSVYNKGEVMTARDVDGAVRFLSFGNLQLDRELREFHQSKMQDRRRSEGLLSEKQKYLLVERDVLQLPRGQYEQWPLFDGSLRLASKVAEISSAIAVA